MRMSLNASLILGDGGGSPSRLCISCAHRSGEYARHTGSIQWHVKLQNLLAGMAARQVAGLSASTAGPAPPQQLVDGWSAQHISAKDLETQP